MLSSIFKNRSLTRIAPFAIRGVATRYSYNKTIPQTMFSRENIILGSNPLNKDKYEKEAKITTRTKLGLASGKVLPAGEYYSRHTQYDDEKNIVEDILTPYDKPFHDLIRDDLWVLDPMSLKDSQIPDALNLLPCPKSAFDIVAPGSRTMRLCESVCHGAVNIGKITVNIVTDPIEAKSVLHHSLSSLRSGISSIWTSMKLYGLEVRTGSRLFWKLLYGGQLTYREKKQLRRAISDTSRLVPFTIFAIIPFSEFALPLVLKKFPNFLPSTFTSEAKRREQQSSLFQARLSVARGYYDRMRESVSVHHREDLRDEACADAMLDTVRRVRFGDASLDESIRLSQTFKDDTVVDHMEKTQLGAVARYLGVLTVGGEEMTRVGLRSRMRGLAGEDVQLYVEGMEGLTRTELEACCERRGMQREGMRKNDYLRRMQEWVQLAVEKKIPRTILIMANMLALPDDKRTIDMLPSAISMLPDDVIKEAIIEVAPLSDPTALKMRYECAVREEEELREEEMCGHFALGEMATLGQVEEEEKEKEKKKKKSTAKKTAGKKKTEAKKKEESNVVKVK